MPENRDFDTIFKRLCALPEMVRSYLNLVPLPEGLKDALDLSSLRQLPTELVSDNLLKRHADLLWQVDYREGNSQLYVIVDIEFQSSRDPTMPLRMLTYAALIYESLWRGAKLHTESYRLPAVVPLVIYTGKEPWQVPQKVDALMGPDLKELRPSFQYLLIDEYRRVESGEEIEPGPAGDLMKFRHASDYAMMSEAEDRILRSEIYQSNRRLYDELAQAFGRRMFSMEVETMDEFKERRKIMDQKSVEKGIEKGRLEGIEFVALQMIEKGIPTSEIQTYTGLTLEQIQDLGRTR